MKWRVLSDGITTAHEGIVLRGGSWWVKLTFAATAFLLEHPRFGYMLVDSGYTDRFFQETRRGWARLYRWITPVSLSGQGSIAQQLEKLGIHPREIQHILITHFHADHVGGLRDFSAARFYASEKAWQDVRGRRGFAAVRRAFLPGLLPDDFTERLTLLKPGDDWLDSSIRTVDLPGHAVGQVGLRFTEDRGKEIFLVADACWHSRAFRENRPPHRICGIFHDAKAYAKTLAMLHEMHCQNPEMLILPSHCSEMLERYSS